MINLNETAYIIHRNSKDKGFYENGYSVDVMLSKLALVHSEVSETLEALRKEQGSNAIAEELSDILIRVLDFFAAAKEGEWISSETDIEQALYSKILKNKNREYRHGVLA